MPFSDGLFLSEGGVLSFTSHSCVNLSLFACPSSPTPPKSEEEGGIAVKVVVFVIVESLSLRFGCRSVGEVVLSCSSK